jgi:uncharacterized protein YuzE
MGKIRMNYFEEEDILHLVISEGEESTSVELNPNIIAELGKKGELLGIEILDASSFIRDFVLETAQAKMLHLNDLQQKTAEAKP